MAKDKSANAYIKAMGFGNNSASQNKPWDQWLASKLPAAFGGMFAHTVYQNAIGLFSKQAKDYGPDIVGSIALTIIAYILDHDMVGLSDGFSDDFSQSFTDGMMGRGAPAVYNAIGQAWRGLTSVVSPNAKKADGMEGPSLDRAPEALAEMMSLLANSPETRQKMALDLISVMEGQNMNVDSTAKSKIANCINDLARNYQR